MIELHRFPSSEAALISGVSMDSQRDWRRRGILPKSDAKRARFDVFDIAGLACMSFLAERGVGPTHSRLHAEVMGKALGQVVLGRRDAWDAQVDQIPTELALTEDERGREWRIAILNTHTKDIAHLHWEMRCDVLMRELGSVVHPTEFGAYCWWANGIGELVPGIIPALEAMDDDDPRLAGAVILLDFHALADVLLKRASRPFASWRPPVDPGGKE